MQKRTLQNRKRQINTSNSIQLGFLSLKCACRYTSIPHVYTNSNLIRQRLACNVQHVFTSCISYLSRMCPSSAGGKGRGGRVDVLWRAVCRSGLYVESGAGDFAWDVTEETGR